MHASDCELIPISSATLSYKWSVGAAIYLKTSNTAKPVLFCSASEKPTPEKLKPILESEHRNKFFIDQAGHANYQTYLREHWQELLADESMSQLQKASLLSDVMRDVMSEEFAAGDTDSIVEKSKALGKGAQQLVAGGDLWPDQLCRVLQHDYATFTHSTNVSLYCALLAKELGYTGDDLEAIAVGGLLHDIGKIHIDEQILTKPGRLDEFEFREIKKHPTEGFIRLAENPSMSFGQLAMAYQHHERMNGQGYPVGIVDQEIHPWARLCAIVDVYEAITSLRPYRKPMETSTALKVLEKGRGTEFDSDMLDSWLALHARKGGKVCQTNS